MNPKDIILKLSTIKYSGKSIGDDIRVEIEALGQPFNKNKQIKKNTTAKFDKEIGRFPVQQRSYTLPVTIRIIERDWVFNDVGSKEVKIKVDLSKSTPQKSVHRVEVFESRWEFVKPKAVFDVTLEVTVVDAIRYIEESKDGFLLALFDNGKEESLPAFLKVRYHRRESKRDYFTILEGVYQDQKASIKFKKDGSSYLLSGNPHNKSARVKYSISKNKIYLKGKSYPTVPQTTYKWRRGFYDIEIPDAPHKMPDEYLEKAPKSKIWFRIGHNRNDKEYIHTGLITAGCITMNRLERWNEVYNVLIKARKDDSQSVGILEVID